MKTIEDLLIERSEARLRKDWATSDTIRAELDVRRAFVIDTKDGQEVYHLPDQYFARKPGSMTERQYLEHRIKKDIKSEAAFDAWLFSTKKSARI